MQQKIYYALDGTAYDYQICEYLTINDAAKLAFEAIKDKQVSNLFVTGFERGANWHKEQLQHLLESHAELLDNLKRIIDRINENDWSEYIPSAYDRAKLAIEKANNINH